MPSDFPHTAIQWLLHTAPLFSDRPVDETYDRMQNTVAQLALPVSHAYHYIIKSSILLI